jgi:hypothetical protein
MAGVAQDAQKKEAEKHISEARKAMGTSWWSFKCRADILTASVEYTAAATCFRNAKMISEAVEAWKKPQIYRSNSTTNGAQPAHTITLVLCVMGMALVARQPL